MILLYSCKVWGYENIDIIEKVHLKFLKFILNLKSSTPNCMVYGETGRYPLLITVKTRMIMYWAKILMGNDNKLTSVFYRYFYKCYTEGSFLHPWLKRVHDILNSCGLSYVWIDQDFRNINWLKTCINDTLKNNMYKNGAVL